MLQQAQHQKWRSRMDHSYYDQYSKEYRNTGLMILPIHIVIPLGFSEKYRTKAKNIKVEYKLSYPRMKTH